VTRSTQYGTIVPLANETTFLIAGVVLNEGRRWVFIYRSPLVQETDKCMESVYLYLAEVCFFPGDPEMIDDEDMMFGQAEQTIHELLPLCPGAVVPHNCYRVRTGLVQGIEGMVA
jgi:hypothetical protein